ncbi:hypothetical protein BMW23_0448 [Bodo saltans virus]|jgi:hypothetical protein|uniref:Uncharacterized protein n=1 Tax=Bodo saltans virus TaxID=2024608 RepID=A0A2H4UU95_9VIRU|nr:hypothetical protein QJ851_gp0437 [Bodo saltans virus]ATZ80500.1 hypothetical protein BMW23_0448 [Bodo saltans virus]
MNAFTDILFLFVLLTVLFYFKLPNINNTNYILHKFIIFVCILAFSYIIELIKAIKTGCKVDPKKILWESLNTALYGVIGYSLYVDLMYMNISCFKLDSVVNADENRFIIASFVTSLFVLLIKAIKLIFTNTE